MEVFLGELLDVAVVHADPVLLRGHQPVAHLAKDLLVAGADLAAVVHDGEVDDVAHLRHHVDHALELVRRVQEDRRSVDVALVVLGVHHHPGRAPLPGHRVVPAGIPVDVHPALVHVREVRHLVGPRLEQQVLPDPDRDVARRRHHDVEAVPARLHLGERGVVRVVVGDGDLDVVHRLELLDQLRIGVVAPVVDVELSRREGASRTRQQRRPGEGACQSSHQFTPRYWHFADVWPATACGSGRRTA